MQILAMPKNSRRRLLFRVAKLVIRDSKKHVKNQTDLQGKPFVARQRKRTRKMLSRLVKGLKVVNNNATHATIGFSSSKNASIAAKHQFGHTDKITASALKKGKGRNAPATRRQAKALRAAGYSIKTKNGKRDKTPSLKWVQSNMKIGQAGMALRYLREQQGASIKSSWETKIPARSFLGATSREVTQYIEKTMKDMTREIQYVTR